VARRLELSLSAEQRTSLRGHRLSACGQDLVLQLPRDGALQPGDWLLSDDGFVAVQVVAAPEQLLRVSAPDPLALLQAAYHLGNRHVALELHGDHLLLQQDPVLQDLLQHRGLAVQRIAAPFLPESGAYASTHGDPAHGHHHHP
jgi:urease accessory protein